MKPIKTAHILRYPFVLGPIWAKRPFEGPFWGPIWVQIAPPPLLGGRDLMQLGFEPGPQFKDILNAVEDAQLEGQLATHADAVEWVKQQWGEKR